MRFIAYLILTALLTIGILFAQEQADPGAEKKKPKLGGFIPSEVVKADTAIPFPTDI